MANRQGRIKAVIAKDISEIIRFDLKNTHIGMVSVNEVQVSDDYSQAKVFVSFIGAKYPLQNFEELSRCKGIVRSALAKKIDLRKTPEISFVYDTTYEKAASLDEALAREKDLLDSLKKPEGK